MKIEINKLVLILIVFYWQEIKTIQLEEVLNERADEEMDCSDTEEEFQVKKRRTDSSEDRASVNTLKVSSRNIKLNRIEYYFKIDPSMVQI